MGSESVLLVEDDPGVRAVVRSVLRKHGYDVVEACDGAEALEIITAGERSVHVVVSDVVMPRLSGRLLVRRLAELAAPPRVLLISGYPMDEIERHGDIPDVVPLLDKPFTIAALTRKIREVLDGPAQF